MLFDTPVYFLFLLVVVAVYWSCSRRGQNRLLLIASYFFYGWWNWRFLALMAGSTLVDYHLGKSIAATANPRRRKLFLVVSLLTNFGFLAYFKYCNFFIDSFVGIMALFGSPDRVVPYLHILLPAGISFYTFQAVAYIVDVYFKRIEPAKSLGEYALFISLFPHLIAGPIQRPSHLLPQVQSERHYDSKMVFGGLLLIVTGLFRKCVIADNCALLANSVFDGKFGEPSLPLVLIGAYAFAWQIYGDFSGYSDIARGSAQLMGFHFMVNFRQPYLATSLSDFWRRWHISLSTWLRDYLYIPLGGNRRGEARTYRNLFITMVLGGLWHGANWVFVIWGALHGVGLAAERWLGIRGKHLAGPPRNTSGTVGLWARRILIFHIVCFAWIFFRAASFGDAVELLAGVSVLKWSPLYLTAFQFLALFTLPLLLLDLRLEHTAEEYPFQKMGASNSKVSYVLRAGAAAVLLVGVLIMGATESSAFIYFQF
jgi:D-alanyl-lipoteichoic acid acyltransferase DltB (MBOAT superfamily)